MAKTKQTIPLNEVLAMAAMERKGYPQAEIARQFCRDHKTVQQLLCDLRSPHRDVLATDPTATNTKDDSTLRIRCRGCGCKTSRVCKKDPLTCVGCDMRGKSQVLVGSVQRRF